MFKWFRENIAILILAASILIHAWAVINTPQAYDVQKVQIVNQWNPVPVKIIK